jgi:molybdate/tungstate transport system substrate-binding protein
VNRKRRRRNRIGEIGALLAAVFFLAASGPASAGERVIIFHAGSLSSPLARMEKIFEKRHPGIDIIRKAGGSTKMARMISEKGEKADIMASADFAVIDKALIPRDADWNIRFASNQLVLCYTDKSRYAAEINAENWPDILARKDVVWGHSEPNLDPCGYRSLMVLQLAEKYFKRPGLYDRLIANRPAANVRPKAVELVSLLKKGKMDYAWEYLSVAVQKDLRYVRLSDRINLSNSRYDPFYRQATVEVAGKKPGTRITRTGKAITYGVTLIKNAPNPAGAVEFLDYLLDPEGGLKVLEEMGQPPFVPCRVPSEKIEMTLPATLRSRVETRQ